MTGHTEGLLPLSSGGAGIQGALRSNSKLPHSYPGRGEAQGPRCPRKAPPFLSLTSDKEKRIFLSASLFHSGVLCSSSFCFLRLLLALYWLSQDSAAHPSFAPCRCLCSELVIFFPPLSLPPGAALLPKLNHHSSFSSCFPVAIFHPGRSRIAFSAGVILLMMGMGRKRNTASAFGSSPWS